MAAGHPQDEGQTWQEAHLWRQEADKGGHGSRSISREMRQATVPCTAPVPHSCMLAPFGLLPSQRAFQHLNCICSWSNFTASAAVCVTRRQDSHSHWTCKWSRGCVRLHDCPEVIAVMCVIHALTLHHHSAVRAYQVSVHKQLSIEIVTYPNLQPLTSLDGSIAWALGPCDIV